MPRTVKEISRPVTVVTEPLVGSVGPLGVLSLAFLDDPELSGPDVRFLATLAALTAQALERAQVFEHERGSPPGRPKPPTNASHSSRR